MGTIKTTNIEPIADNGTVTLGSSGDTFTLGSGVVQSNLMYPAFYVKKTSNQTLTTNTYTKITFDSEIFDTDSAYSSDKFTVPTDKAGKYFIGAACWCDTNAITNFSYANIAIYKNGSEKVNLVNDSRINYTYQHSLNLNYIDNLSASDYLEVYARISDQSGDPQVNGNSSLDFTYFYGYRIGS